MMQFVLAWAAREVRPVYYDNIEGMQQPWQAIKFEDWQTLPPRAILVVDEAQFKIPTRGRGEPVEWIQRLATHGHNGLDIVLVTQDPMLIDAFVRRLCQRHFHVMRKFGMQRATVHEYTNGVRDIVAKSRGESIRHEWKYPVELFGKYHSADAHTVKRNIPMKVWVLLAVPFIFAGLVAYTWFFRLSPDVKKGPVTNAFTGQVAGVASPGQSVSAKLTAAEYVAQFQPRVGGLAYTAPAYDDVTKPVEAPYPAACVQMGKRCGCYTQQGTALDTPMQLCLSIVGGGFYVAWQARPAPVPPTAAVAPLSPAGGLMASAGSFSAAGGLPALPMPIPDPSPARGAALPKLAR